MTGRRVLVVDDEESVRWALTKALERAGYRVDLAADGPSGSSAAENPDVDLVLLDVRLPGRDGLAVLGDLRERRPDLLIEGPIQYDAAVSEEVARIKLKDSRVAGRATVYIFPDLDAGNTAYKAVQRSANVPAIGPIMQGLRKPANDLSRGATVEDIVYTIAITAIQAQQNGRK
jgi:CheY-like chemotaxis protein